MGASQDLQIVEQQFQQGLHLYQQKQIEAALAVFREALEQYRQLQNRAGEAQALYHLGHCSFSREQYKRAIAYYQEALTLFQAIPDRLNEVNVLYRLGKVYAILTTIYASPEVERQALSYYQQSLQLAQTINDRTGIERARKTIDQFQGVSMTQPALKQGESSALQTQSLLDQGDQAYQLGIQFYNQQQLATAASCFQQSVTAYQQVNDRRAEADAQYWLGLCQEHLKHLQDAIAAYQRALSLHQALGVWEWAAKSAFRSGYVAQSLQADAQAASDYQRAVSLAQSWGDHRYEADACHNLGLCYEQLQQYQSAMGCYQRAMALYQTLADIKWQAKTLLRLGKMHDHLGQTAPADAYYQQALAVLPSLGITPKQLGLGQSKAAPSSASSDLQAAKQTFQQGIQLYKQCRFREALDRFQQILPIYRDLKDRNLEAQCLNNIGLIYDTFGQYTLAIDYHTQSLQIARAMGDRSGEAASLSNLGIAYDVLGQYTQAIDYHTQSLQMMREMGDRNGEAASLSNLGSAYRALGQYPLAIDYHTQSLEIARAMGDRSREARSLSNLGLALFIEGNASQAEPHLYNALDVLESLRQSLTDKHKISFFETMVSPYTTLQEVLIAQGKIEAALEIAERGRARALVELLAKRLSPAQFDQLLHSQIAQPPTLAAIQQIAQLQEATLVEYSIIGDSILYIWVVQPSGTIACRSVDLSALKTALVDLVDRAHLKVSKGRDLEETEALIELLVRGLHDDALEARRDDTASERLTSTRPQVAMPYLQRLHQVLIEPIADLLPFDSHQPVIFIPHRVLFLVPFVALQDSDGHYLIEKHTILTAPSIQVLNLTHQQRQSLGAGCKGWSTANPPATLIVGNPTMPRVGHPPQQLSSLSGAETEARLIARFFQTHALTGDHATESAVKQQIGSAQIVHLASHGLLNEMADGVPGAIALAPSPDQDGLFTASDILELHLQAELVVLSACNTGRGKITGDGVIGLSRAFITDGVPSIIVSLWSIPDAPTAPLMMDFYRNWQQGLDKAQALRQAMLTIMQTHPHPRDWAAFTLMGEAE